MARNIRLDTLPSDRPTENRDCQLCIRRRIKCDRTLPSCYKCQSRNLLCPGPAPRLKWVDGLTARGKRRAKAHPILEQTITKKARERELRHSPPLAAFCKESRTRHFSSTAFFEDDTIGKAQDVALSNRATLATLSSFLTTHFLLHVTPRLRWIDHENPWRKLLLPHSRTSILLHFAILSLSAAHVSVTTATGTACAQAFRWICKTLSQETMNSLTTQIRHRLARNCDNDEGGTPQSTIEMLATMFVLCHVEMLLPESQTWVVHVRAFRAVCDQECLSKEQSLLLDPLTLFVKKAMADIEVFEIPSSFREGCPSSQTPPMQPTFGDRVWNFTAFSREVAAFERSLHDRQDRGLANPNIDMAPWRRKLDVASSVARFNTSTLWAGLTYTRAIFNKVVSAHYLAGLIYCHQALARPDEAYPVIQAAVDKLVIELQFITTGPVRDFDQDVFWPLFIAGTECGSSEDQQATLQTQLQDLITSTGFWCNYKALRFLQLFWTDSEKTSPHNWIHYARKNASQFGAFLVY